MKWFEYYVPYFRLVDMSEDSDKSQDSNCSDDNDKSEGSEMGFNDAIEVSELYVIHLNIYSLCFDIFGSNFWLYVIVILQICFRHSCKTKYLGLLNKNLIEEQKLCIEGTPFWWFTLLNEFVKISWNVLSVLCNLWVEKRCGFLLNSKVVPFKLLDVCLGLRLRIIRDGMDLMRLTLIVYLGRILVRRRLLLPSYIIMFWISLTMLVKIIFAGFTFY